MHTKVHRIDPGSKVRMKDLDPEGTPLCDDKADGKERCVDLESRLGERQEWRYAAHKHNGLVILHGMEASGKDVTGRHVLNAVSLPGARLVAVHKPAQEELDHQFLWRD